MASHSQENTKPTLFQKIINSLSDGTYRDFIRDWKWIFSYSKKYWKIVLFYVLLGIFSTSFGLVSSIMSKHVIDIITTYQTDQLWLLISLMIGSMVFSLVFSSLVGRVSLKLNILVHNDIQSEIFDKIMDADWSHLSAYSNGDLLNRFNSDVGTISGNAVSWIPNVIISLYSFLATLAVILHYNALMAFISFMSAPILLGCSRILIRKNKEFQKKIKELNSSMMSFETETFYNLDTIKSFGISVSRGRDIRNWQAKYKKLNLDYNTFCIIRNISLSVLSSVIGFVAFGYCLYLLWSRQISYGTMTLFLGQRASLSNAFESVIKILPEMINSTVSVDRIRELVELPKEVHNEEAVQELISCSKDGFTVELKDVCYAYKDSDRVLDSCNLIAAPNEMIALTGASGEGKTTLLRIFLGLIHPDSGTALLHASNGHSVPFSVDTRQFFSYVPQGNTLLSGTIAENLRIANEQATDEELIAALQTACAWDFVEKLPLGIHSPLGERGRGLSEGQAQRISIARAILRNSPILMLDEATSALDADTEQQLLSNLFRDYPNKTCIVTSHRTSILHLCQRVYHIKNRHLTQLSDEEIKEMYSS